MEKYGPPRETWPRFKLDFPEAQAWPERLNIAEILVDENVKMGRGGKVAILHEEEKMTYGELQLMVNRFGNALKSLGVGVGDRVMLRLPNIPEFIVSNLAAQRIGAVSVPTFTQLRAKEISYIANDCEAKILITLPSLLEEVEKVMDELKTIKRIILVGAKSGEIKDTYIAFNNLIDEFRYATHLNPVYVDQDEVALLLYTSGTTGPPKGCIHTHRHYLAVADCYAKNVLMADEKDVWGGPITMAFSYGHQGLMANPFRHEAAASLMGTRKFEPILMFELIEKHRISIFYAVPTAYRAMVALKEERKNFDFSSLRVCVTAGEMCSPSLYHEVKEFFGCEVLEHIGCTELLHAFISSRFGQVKPGSMGLPVPGYDVKILDDEGKECPPGVVGHLAVTGPVGTRYWKRPEKQVESVKDGWNYTGDVAYKDVDGFFWFVGRSDDIIKTAAYRVSPHEVEDVLVKHPAVAEIGVVGIPDPVRGQIIKAFIVLKSGFKPNDKLKEEIKEFTKSQIAPYKTPREIEFVAELPKTETGKIRRDELRKRG
jgi:2-aminobenzoate-CoA ligase